MPTLPLGQRPHEGLLAHGPGWPCSALGPAGDHAGTLRFRIGHHTARHPRCGGVAERGAAGLGDCRCGKRAPAPPGRAGRLQGGG